VVRVGNQAKARLLKRKDLLLRMGTDIFLSCGTATVATVPLYRSCWHIVHTQIMALAPLSGLSQDQFVRFLDIERGSVSPSNEIVHENGGRQYVEAH
jgi:hypothetical protein